MVGDPVEAQIDEPCATGGRTWAEKLQGSAALCNLQRMSDKSTNNTSVESGDAPVVDGAPESTATEGVTETSNSAEQVASVADSAPGGASEAPAAQAPADTPADAAPPPSEATAVEDTGGDAANESADVPEESAESQPKDDSAERIAELEAANAKLEQEKTDNWNRYLRATADVENVRKRGRRDAEDARVQARSKVLKEMLPVIDNLERALEHAERGGAESGADGGIIEGVKLVMRQFSQALDRCEVSEVEAVGKPFDPNVHEAISQIETADHPSGTVVQALQKGYKIGARLLRPSLVVVAKTPAIPAEPADEEPVATPETASSDSGLEAEEEQAATHGRTASEESGSDRADSAAESSEA